MDARLLAWAHAAKARAPSGIPPLWLFTDPIRLPDPCAAVSLLPKGLCGVVFRHDAHPERVALGRRLAAICRDRRLLLVVAGDWRLAARLGAGRHLRAGRPGRRSKALLTSSAHNAVELRRARRAGAALAFRSPAFPTASHPGAAALGATRWCRLSRQAGLKVAALGGIDGRSIRRLPWRFCHTAGAIGALAPVVVA